jgi:UDP:flavonoid glycosyltransferase YjiC (YdhE family)
VRVLIASAPMLGHAFPLVPVARALQRSGHQVLLATAGDALEASNAGLPTENIAPTFAFGRTAWLTMLRHPLIAKAELTGDAGTRGVGLLFGAVNDAMADALVALARRWRPDMVIYEPLAAAGALAAARVGIPAVLQENSLFDGPSLVRATQAHLTKTLRRHSVEILPPNAATISLAPPSMVGVRGGWSMRYLPYSGEGVLPGWLRQPSDRPRILVSRSTVSGPGGNRLMSAVVAVADRVDAEIVLVRPDVRIRRMRTMPANVRVVEWVPLSAALPTSAGIVHHGGAGTVLAALAAGVPQLVVTGPGDRAHNARLVAARGAGLATAPRDITDAKLTRLLTDTALQSAADDVRREMAAMPSPADLVPRLAALASAG